MSSINPFSGRGAPVSGSRLVGRRLQLDRLKNRLIAESHCSIVGLPRIGKTSVAKEVLRQLEATMTGISFGYITLDAISGPIQAYHRISKETSSNYNDDSAIQCINNHDEAYELFLRTLYKRRRSELKSVLIMDEVDAIVRDDFSDAPLFIARIREVANDRDRYGLTFVFISRRSLDMIQGAVDCSTLAGLCEVIYLQPLDQNGLGELMARSPIPLDDSGREALWSITGGHPFLAEVVMCEAVEQSEPLLTKLSIENAQHAQSHEFTNQYNQLNRLLTHDDMFDALCELVVGPQWRPISPHTVSLLKNYGLLRSSSEAGGCVECMSQHFKDYLTLLTRTTPTWQLLGDAERGLRYLVQDRLLESYGEKWFDALLIEYPKMKDTLEKLPKQRSREKQMFGDAASDFILDYAYIGDLKDIVFAEWEKYRTVLEGSKKDWEKRFQDIMKVRNPLAHHRPVPANVLQEAETSCKALLHRLKGTAKNSN